MLPPLNGHLPDLPNDALLVRTLLHVFYGMAGFVIVLLSGLSVLALLAPTTWLNKTDRLAFALPAGLVTCLVLCIVTATLPYGGIVAGCALLALLASRFTATLQPLSCVKLPVGSAALVLVAVATLAAHMAIMWRPPANGLGGTVEPGDLTLYVGFFSTLEKQVYPFLNLSAEGELALKGLYFNQIQSFLAMGMAWLPGFEIGMFLTSSIVVFYLLSICCLLTILVRTRDHEDTGHLPNSTAFLVAILLIAAIQYPTWVVESPPVAFLSVFTLAVLYGVHRARSNPIGLTAIIGLAALGSALTKVVSLPVLAGYSGVSLLIRCHSRLSRRQLILIGLAGALVAGYALFMIATYGRYFVPLVDLGPESWLRFQRKGWDGFASVIPYLLRDLGLVLFLVGAFLLRDLALALTVAVGILLQFTGSFLFHATPMAAITLVAGALILKTKPSKAAFWTMLLGCLMIIEYHLDEDHGEWHLALISLLCVGSAVWLTLTGGATRRASPPALAPARRHLAWLSLCILAAVSVVGAASGAMRLGDDKRVIVPPALIDIWEKTRALVPRDGLVFTDQVGFGDHSLSDLNDLSLVAQRQIFIGSFSISALRHDADARRERLAQNSAILDGSLQPDELTLSRSYDGFFAVLSRAHRAPPGFEQLYRNEGYALYRIAAVQPAR